ncbi:MAG: PfkB family carbohydrate kinase, partial [Chloroflexota bacterium]|nr:PfkB family carbohydrate kinase [Chloroflexota bacterium]
MSAELVCIGLATLDTIVAVPEWPEPDGRLVVDGLLRAGGGPAATAAVAAAAAGRSVAFVGAVGRDDQATLVRHGLLAGGIDVTHLVEQAGPTPESVILVHGAGGTRSILHAPGATRESLGTAAR